LTDTGKKPKGKHVSEIIIHENFNQEYHEVAKTAYLAAGAFKCSAKLLPTRFLAK
jgi:hypothetical protein